MDEQRRVGAWLKVSELGSGAFGVVTLWKNNETNDFIAIKKCKFVTPTSLTHKHKERWIKEVEIMKIINHPNIVKFRTIPQDLEKALLSNNPSKLPLLSMEYCCKGNLRTLLSKPKNTSGLTETEVRHVLHDVSSGLRHLHNLNVTHRDVKPENIVLQHCDERNTNTVYKIIDLGYAKELSDATVSFVGTLHYLAPEIFETVKYDCSVDYWSMGMVAFEVTCGILPFLPHLSPPERFPEIKKKAPEDICIFLNYSGQVTNSSEIKKENYISSCLKRDLEKWLQHVLQFDPVMRIQPFPNNVKTFDYLLNVLQKKIVKVFSVHKLEFYSYEVDNSTLIGTLKDWISRDIKSSKKNIILLMLEKGTFCNEDGKLISEILNDDDVIYVIRKDAFVNYPLTYNFPKLVREVAKAAARFQNKFIVPLYSQTIYYLTVEKNICHHLKACLKMFNDYLGFIVKTLKKNIYSSSKNIVKMLTKIECLNSLKNNNVQDLNDNEEYKNCLVYNQRLLANLERCLNAFQKLEKQSEKVMGKHGLLQESWPEILELIQEYNLEKQYESIATLLDKTERGKNVEKFKGTITEAISGTLKIKEETFKNKKLLAYTSAMLSISNYCESMLTWTKEFDRHIEELSASFVRSEVMFRDILIEMSSKNKKEKSPSISSLKDELQNLRSDYLIQENQEIRYKFDEVLSQSILAHKKYVSAIKDLFPPEAYF